MDLHTGIRSKHGVQIRELVFKALIQSLQRTGGGGVRYQDIFQERDDVLADKIIDIQQDTAIQQRVLHLLKLTADDPCQLVKHTLHSVDDVRIVKVDRRGGGRRRAGVGRGDLALGLCQERRTHCICKILTSDIHLSNAAADRGLTSTLDDITGCAGATPHGDLTGDTVHVQIYNEVRHSLICNLDRAGAVTRCAPYRIYIIHSFNDFIFTVIDSRRR